MESNPESFASPEAEGDVLFEEYLAAEREVETILQEINEILRQAHDRSEAEQELLQTHAPRLDHATEQAREQLDRWLAYVRRQGRKE